MKTFYIKQSMARNIKFGSQNVKSERLETLRTKTVIGGMESLMICLRQWIENNLSSRQEIFKAHKAINDI